MSTRRLVWTLLIFFFSSRRRHTRCYRDWSSDVSSSDLACHYFRSVVHECNASVIIRGNHRVCYASEGRGKLPFAFPYSPFHLMPVTAHFNGRIQLSLLERFEDIAEWLGDLCSLKRAFIRMRSEKYYPDGPTGT